MTKHYAYCLTALTTLLIGSPAWAVSLEDCGQIHVEAEAECTAEVDGGCTAQCTPLACSAKLYVGCRSECDLDAEAACSGTCDVEGCRTECEAGNLDCSTNCKVDCSAHCSGDCETQCAADADSAACVGECEGSCEATCQGECDAQCDVDLPDCDTKCEASCQGSCKAQANLSCQSECQSEGSLACQGGCEAACEAPEGQIFCDGQWVDHGGHLDACIDAIREHVDAEFESSGSASCDNGSCEAEGEARGEASADCAMSPARPENGLGFWALGAAGAALLAGRRRSITRK